MKSVKVSRVWLVIVAKLFLFPARRGGGLRKCLWRCQWRGENEDNVLVVVEVYGTSRSHRCSVETDRGRGKEDEVEKN